VTNRYRADTLLWKRLALVFPAILWPLAMISAGICGVIRPTGMLGWAKHAHPQIKEDDPTAQLCVRLICAGGCVIGVIVLLAFVL
jgi:hypothetical protein